MKRGDSRRLGTACSLKRTNIPRFNVELAYATQRWADWLKHEDRGKVVMILGVQSAV